MKKLFMIVLSLCLLCSLATGAYPAGKKIVWRVNMVVGPTEPAFKGFVAAGEYIKEKTNGQVEVQVFPSGQLGSHRTIMLDVQQGQYDMTAISPANMGSYYKPAGILNFPYMFRDSEHMLKVCTGEVGKELYAGFEKVAKTIVVLDTWYYGTRHLTSNIKGTTPEELSKVRMRIYTAPIAYQFANALGTKPTPIAFPELYLALKTGTVDAQENPIPTIYLQKFYEVQKYLILTGHVIAPIIPVMNRDSLDKVPAEFRDIVMEGFKHGGDVANKMTMDGEANLIETLKKSGMEVVTPPDLTPFRDRAKKAAEDLEKEWGPGMIEKIQSIK